jgi:hypothetical protein
VKDPVNFPKKHMPELNKFIRAAAERHLNDMMVLVVSVNQLIRYRHEFHWRGEGSG